jgi:hypothetical protein
MITNDELLNKLVNGTGTRYEVILEAIRDNLKFDITTTDGCIAFYNYDSETSDTMLMKVFPFKPEVINSYFPSDIKTRIAVLERINADRPYSEMHHLTNFRNKYKSKQHFNLSIKDKELLYHDNIKINGKEWASFVSDTNIGNNTFDNLLFSSGQRGFQIFPIPVLSSPCMLLIIPAGEGGDPDSIAAKMRETIDFYLYNRLISEITKDLKPGLIKDKNELITRFLKELSQVAIPVLYMFNGNTYKCFDWYGEWKIESCVTVNLDLENEEVKLYMPTFCCFNGKMLHEIPHYHFKVKQVTETIQNIFRLVYSNWEAINNTRSQGRFVLKQIIEDSGLNMNLLEHVDFEINKVKAAIESAVNISEENYASALKKVSSKTVSFKKLYDASDEVGYQVTFNDEIIVEYNYTNPKKGKQKKHFGYDAIEEIINNGNIKANEFSFFEEVRDVLPKNTSSNGLNDNQNNESVETDEDGGFNNYYSDDTGLIELKDSLSIDEFVKETIKSVEVLENYLNKIKVTKKTIPTMNFEDFVLKISNLEYIKQTVSEFKKTIDTFHYSGKHIKLKGELKEASKYINILHAYLISNMPNYAEYHQNSGTTETARYVRSLKPVTSSGDNRVVEKISNNINQLCNRLILHTKYGDIFQNNFQQAGLIYEKGNRNFKYDQKSIELKYDLKWEFD